MCIRCWLHRSAFPVLVVQRGPRIAEHDVKPQKHRIHCGDFVHSVPGVYLKLLRLEEVAEHVGMRRNALNLVHICPALTPTAPDIF